MPSGPGSSRALISRLLPIQRRRIGITGVPGAGKSSFIEAFGTRAKGSGGCAGY
ncbi:MAG: hypothetical protein ACLT38_10870 [Akkermansia sp.]